MEFTEYIVNLILLFFIYSFAGWCMEVILKYRQFHRFINRGFLTGPVLPIYGTGVVLITVVIGNLSRIDSSVGTTFALSFLICGTVEYLTSYVLEKRFHARWWDYSQKPMNLHGRVWIGNLLLFGAAGVFIMHISNPLIYRVLGHISGKAKEIIAIVLLVVFMADYVVSHFVLKLVKVSVESSEADNTEEISKEVHQLLSDRSYFHKRFADAYPDVIYRTERVKERLEAVKKETERLRREAEQRIEARAEKVADTLQPSVRIRNTIISDQDKLIRILYDEETATDEMKTLKAEIDRGISRLEARPIARHLYNKVSDEE